MFEFHEAANLFPLDEDSIPELADDIKKNGQHLAVELLDGKVIDGRRRCLACKRLGIKPKTRDVEVDDPIAYSLSLNLVRRHLSVSQLAMVGRKAKAMYTEQAKTRQKLSHGRGVKGPVMLPDLKGDARDLAGKAVGVSGSLIDRAETVVEKGVPELAKAVEEGRMSVTSAAKIATMDEELQRRAAQEAEFSGGRYRRKTVEEDTEPVKPNGKLLGVGVVRANEAVNCLARIPKNDPLRKRGFQIVKDWIRHNP